MAEEKQKEKCYSVSEAKLRNVVDIAEGTLNDARKKALDSLLAGSPNDAEEYKKDALRGHLRYEQTINVLTRLGLIGPF